MKLLGITPLTRVIFSPFFRSIEFTSHVYCFRVHYNFKLVIAHPQKYFGNDFEKRIFMNICSVQIL